MMGIFSKTIPQRKWQDVSLSLYSELKDFGATWVADFVKYAKSEDIQLTTRELTPEIDSAISSLQWAVASTTIREGGYVKLDDYIFFIGLLYISLTGKKVEEMPNDPGMKLLEVDDAEKVMQMWGNMMLPLVSNSSDNPKLAEALAQWSVGIILRTKILTAEACFDRKGADALRNMLE
jgi:hypothetical protein